MMKATLLICFALVVCSLAHRNFTRCNTDEDCGIGQCCPSHLLDDLKHCHNIPKTGQYCSDRKYWFCPCGDGAKCESFTGLGYLGTCKAEETTAPEETTEPASP